MQICWRARTWACGRFWSNLSGQKHTRGFFVTTDPVSAVNKNERNKYKDLSDCDTKSWRLSVSSTSTQTVWYKSHVCFQMSLHIRNFKKAISVTALDKQQNQHRGKRNRQNMYTQIRSIWSWRYWMKTEIFLCFMFCLSYFFKNSKSLEG